MRVGIVPGCAVKKEITIEECLLPINATLFGVNFDPPHQMVHACECGDDTDISVSEELYEAMRQHFAAHRWLLDSPPNAPREAGAVAPSLHADVGREVE